MSRGALQVWPPSVVFEKNASPVKACVCGLSSGLSVGATSVSQTVYAVPALTGSAVVEFLSVMFWPPLGMKETSVTRLLQVLPPSVEVAAATAFLLSVRSNETADAETVPSGPNDTQGRAARWNRSPPGA